MTKLDLEHIYYCWLITGALIIAIALYTVKPAKVIVSNELSTPVTVALLRQNNGGRANLSVQNRYLFFLPDRRREHTLSAGESRTFVYDAGGAPPSEAVVGFGEEQGYVPARKAYGAYSVTIHTGSMTMPVPMALENAHLNHRTFEYFATLFSVLPFLGLFYFIPASLVKRFKRVGQK